jgi:hypothetical protein
MVVTEVMRRRVRLPGKEGHLNVLLSLTLTRSKASGMAGVVAALRTAVPVVTLLVGLCMRRQLWSISCPITVGMVETPSPVIHTGELQLCTIT